MGGLIDRDFLPFLMAIAYWGSDNTTPLGGSLPRRSQRPGRKNSLSQRPCVRDQGEPYSNCGFRLWSI